LRKKGVKMKNSGVFSKTVENIGLKQEKTGRFVNWALGGSNRFKKWVNGFGSGRLDLDRPMNQEVQI